MKRTQIYVLIASSAGMIALLLSLFFLSPLSREIPRSNFERVFISDDSIEFLGEQDIEFNSFYFAGSTTQRLYFGNSTAPFHLLSMNYQLTDTQHVNLKIRLDSVINILSFELRIDSPYFYLAHGIQPIILRGTLENWEANSFLKNSDYYFNDFELIGRESFILKSYNSKTKSFELAKKVGEDFQWQDSLLNKKIDGVFCVDGAMHFDKTKNQLVYMYFYRNEIIVADSNLRHSFTINTIDTFRTPRLKIASIGDQNESMPSQPPFQVNGISYLTNGLLFIQSNLLAKNELRQSFENGYTFDIYSIDDRKYLKSFHLPKYRKYNLKDIQIHNNALITIFDHYIVSYKINISTLTSRPG